MNPDCHRHDHGDSAVVCYRETDLVYSRGGVGVKDTDPCLGGSFSEVPPLDVTFKVTGYPAAGLDGLNVMAAVGCIAAGNIGFVILGCNSSTVVEAVELPYGERILFCCTSGIRATQRTNIVRVFPIIRLSQVFQTESLEAGAFPLRLIDEIISPGTSPFLGDRSVLFEGSLGTHSAISR